MLARPIFLQCFHYFPQEFVIKKLLAGKKLINVGRGEMKIALVIIFVMINGIINMIVYTRGHLARSSSLLVLEEHLICESMGQSAECTPIEESEISDLTLAGGVILSLFPVVVILVTCDLRACKKRKQSKRKTLKNVTSTTSFFSS